MEHRWPSVLVTWALLFAGLTNAHAHVHLCFDGQEAPAAVHVAEGVDHPHEHPATDAAHEDVDVEVANAAVAKAFKHDLHAVLFAAALTLAYERAPAIVAAPLREAPPKQSRTFLRPPLRAPPR